MTISAYTLYIRLTGTSQPWTAVHSSATLVDVETEAARYRESGHKAQQIRCTRADGTTENLGSQIALYVEFLVHAWQRGSLKDAGHTVRLMVQKDEAMCLRISDAFSEVLSTTAAGRQCLAPVGDRARQYNSITQDAPVPA